MVDRRKLPIEPTLDNGVLEMTAISEAIPPQKTNRSRALTFVLLFGSLAFVALSAIAPFVNAAHFSASIKDALETSLGRRVTFGKVFYRIFPCLASLWKTLRLRKTLHTVWNPSLRVLAWKPASA